MEDFTMAMLLEFSMFPMGQGESVSKYVARSLEIIDKSGINYRLNAMGTILEGEWDEVMSVVKQCLDAMSSDSDRVSCSMKMDWRKGATGRLEAKIASVEREVGKELKR
jgi:uncharacterized protein (TIGR00106 family)